VTNAKLVDATQVAELIDTTQVAELVDATQLASLVDATQVAKLVHNLSFIPTDKEFSYELPSAQALNICLGTQEVYSRL